MKIHRISIKNFAGVRALELSPRAGLLICGPNGAGKSSILDGLRAALTGDMARVKLKKEWREMISHGERVGTVIVEHDRGTSEIGVGASITTRAGERVRYSAGPEGAEYVAICTPAFSPETVHRQEEA